MNKQQELMSLFKEYIGKTSDTLYRDIYIENSVVTDIIKVMNTSFYVLYHNRLDELSNKFSKFVEECKDVDYFPMFLIDTDYSDTISEDKIKVTIKDWVVSTLFTIRIFLKEESSSSSWQDSKILDIFQGLLNETIDREVNNLNARKKPLTKDEENLLTLISSISVYCVAEGLDSPLGQREVNVAFKEAINSCFSNCYSNEKSIEFITNKCGKRLGNKMKRLLNKVSISSISEYIL